MIANRLHKPFYPRKAKSQPGRFLRTFPYHISPSTKPSRTCPGTKRKRTSLLLAAKIAVKLTYMT